MNLTSNDKSQLSKCLQNSFASERYGGLNGAGGGGCLKLHDGERIFKSEFCTFSSFLVGMWISIAHMICRVLTNHDY